MANILNWLKDKKGNTIVPKTLTKAIQDENGETLETTVQNIENSLDSLNSNLEKWNAPSKNITIKSDTDYSAILQIDTADPTAYINRPCRVLQTSTGSAISNMPSIFPQGTNFIGIRYVDYFNAQNIRVRLEEISPVAGRVWIRQWNGSAWGKWINGNIPYIKKGSYKISTTTSERDITITFDEPFENYIPTILFSINSFGYTASTHITLKTWSSTSFTFTVVSEDNGVEQQINWVAI